MADIVFSKRGGVLFDNGAFKTKAGEYVPSSVVIATIDLVLSIQEVNSDVMSILYYQASDKPLYSKLLPFLGERIGLVVDDTGQFRQGVRDVLSDILITRNDGKVHGVNLGHYRSQSKELSTLYDDIFHQGRIVRDDDFNPKKIYNPGVVVDVVNVLRRLYHEGWSAHLCAQFAENNGAQKNAEPARLQYENIQGALKEIYTYAQSMSTQPIDAHFSPDFHRVQPLPVQVHGYLRMACQTDAERAHFSEGPLDTEVVEIILESLAEDFTVFPTKSTISVPAPLYDEYFQSLANAKGAEVSIDRLYGYYTLKMV